MSAIKSRGTYSTYHGQAAYSPARPNMKVAKRTGSDRRGAPAILEALEDGPLDTIAIAKIVGRWPWDTLSLLSRLAVDGLVERVGRAAYNGKTPPVIWRLTEDEHLLT